MDDTLLDTSGGLNEAWELSCRDHAPALGCDWDHLRQAIRREAIDFWRDEAAVGHWRVRLHEARLHVIERALTAEGLDVTHAAPLNERYWGEVRQRWRLFDDALGTLESLRGEGYRLALLTNGPAEMQREKIARFDLEKHFDAVVIEGVFGHGKPNREVFEHALAATGTQPAEAWHIGDNLYADVGGAKNAGLHAVWIHRERLELREDVVVMPDRVIGHLAELQQGLGTPD
jgi:putative hydrolase of the HAD superfamily